MSYYDPDKVEWRSNGDNRVFYAQGLDEPDEAKIVQLILPGMVKGTWSYNVFDGTGRVRLYKFQHIYTAQVEAIKTLNELHERADRETARRAAGIAEPEREYADYHPNSYGAQTLREPPTTAITYYENNQQISTTAIERAAAILGEQQDDDPRDVATQIADEIDALEPLLDELEDELDTPIIVNNALEEMGYTVNSSELDNYLPRDVDGQPLPPTDEELALEAKQKAALKPSRKSAVPKASKTTKKTTGRVKEKT